MLSILIVSGFWWDPRYLIGLVVPLVVLIYVSKIPLTWFRVVLLAMVTALYPVTLAALGQTDPGIYKVLDPQWATTPILVYDFPIAGTLGVTPGGLLWMAAVEIRTMLMASYMFVFIYTTSMAQVTDTLLALKVPNPVVFVIAIVYRLIPDLSRVVENILSAAAAGLETGALEPDQDDSQGRAADEPADAARGHHGRTDDAGDAGPRLRRRSRHRPRKSTSSGSTTSSWAWRRRYCWPWSASLPGSWGRSSPPARAGTEMRRGQ